MSSILSIINLLLKKDVKSRIQIKINDMKDCSNWSSFDHGVSMEDLDLSTFNYTDVIQEKNMWDNIAKLSINLFNDFEFFNRFEFESLYQSQIYSELLQNLGYTFENGRWVSVRRPDILVVQNNVFMDCLYRSIFEEMMKERNYGLEKFINCCFCNQKIKNGKNCDQCGSSIEEIELCQMKINLQKKPFEGIEENKNTEIENKDYECYLENKPFEEIEENFEGALIIKDATEEFNIEEEINVEKRNEKDNEILISEYLKNEDENISEEEKWTCEICSIKNNYFNEVCEFCENKREENSQLRNKGFDQNIVEIEENESNSIGDVELSLSCNRDENLEGQKILDLEENIINDEVAAGEEMYENKDTREEQTENEAIEGVIEGVIDKGEIMDSEKEEWRSSIHLEEINDKGIESVTECSSTNIDDNLSTSLISFQEVNNEPPSIIKLNEEDIKIVLDEGKPELVSLPTNDKWSCKLCSFLNNWEKMECEVCCNEAPHKNKWRCDVCTLINDLEEPNCKACGRNNENVPRVAPGKLFRSLPARQDQVDGETSRGIPPIRGYNRLRSSRRRGRGQRRQVWTCEYCNESNEIDSENCDTCGNNR